jgi:hypothetical protein
MSWRRLPRNPLEQNLLLRRAELCGRVDEVVISGRHRTICYDFTDNLELSALPLRTVGWPIGEIQRLPGLVEAEEIRGRQPSIPNSRLFTGVAIETGTCQSVANLWIRFTTALELVANSGALPPLLAQPSATAITQMQAAQAAEFVDALGEMVDLMHTGGSFWSEPLGMVRRIIGSI